MEIRPAAEPYFAAMHRVLAAAEGGVRERHGFPWRPPPFEAFAATHRHLLGTDPDRLWVAEEDGEIAGFTAALVRDGTWFLSSLFIAPGAQGSGLGSELLERAWGETPERRITIADAIQPVSNAMYAKRGLVPTTPLLELGGEPQLANDGDLEASDPDPATLAALDAAAYGFDRAPDHGFWASRTRATVWRRRGEPVGYAYVSAGGRIGPLAGRDGEAAAATLRAELARAGGAVSLDVPGSARELVETALAAGLRITGPPGLLLLSRGLEPPRTLAISGYWLY